MYFGPRRRSWWGGGTRRAVRVRSPNNFSEWTLMLMFPGVLPIINAGSRGDAGMHIMHPPTRVENHFFIRGQQKKFWKRQTKITLKKISRYALFLLLFTTFYFQHFFAQRSRQNVKILPHPLQKPSFL